MDKTKTSWGGVADWYNYLLESEGTYQKDLILPNLLRLLELKKDEVLLDLACGPGFFAKEFYKKVVKVIGVDVSKELIDIAKKNSPKGIEYRIAPADAIGFIKNKSVDKIVFILAIQNIEDINGVLAECARVLEPSGKLFIVLNHPAFRIPRGSSWGWDENDKIQYRRIDYYLSESKVKIQMHPSTGSGRVLGEKPGEATFTFHRPLQLYFKILNKNGFCVNRLEEWNSKKMSEPGPRAVAENKARKEIPLFLFMEAVNLKK